MYKFDIGIYRDAPRPCVFSIALNGEADALELTPIMMLNPFPLTFSNPPKPVIVTV